MRSELLDRRGGPVENLYTNPQMERLLSGTSQVRRNISPNPVIGVNGGWAAIGGGTGVNYTGAIISGDGPTPDIQTFYRTTKTVLETSGSSWLRVQHGATLGSAYAIPVIPRRVYTFSIMGRWSSPTAQAMVIIAVFRTATNQGAAVAEVVGTNRVDMGKGWYRYYVTATAPVDAAAAYIHFGITAQSKVGDTVDATGAMVEERPGLLPFFFGGSANDKGIAFSWEGTAHASASVGKAQTAEVRRNYAFNPDALPNANRWQIQVPTNHTARDTYEVPTDWTSQYCAVLNVDTVDGSLQQWRMRVGGSAVNLNNPSLNGAASVLLTVSFDFWASSLLAGKVITVELPIVGQPGGASTFRNNFTFTATAGWARYEGSVVVTPQQTVTSIDYFQHPQIVTPYIVVPANTVLFKATRALIEVSPVRNATYFSAGTSPDLDLVVSPVGAEGSSATIMSGVRVATVGGSVTGVYVQSYRTGKALLRCIPITNTSSDIFATIDLLALGLKAGETLTILAKSWQPAPSGYAQGLLQARSLFVAVSGAGGGARANGISASGPDVAGWYSHRLVLRLPPDLPGDPLNGASVRLYLANTASRLSADTFWDEVAIVRGNYTGPYVDGDLPRCVWRGAPHNSKTVGYPSTAS